MQKASKPKTLLPYKIPWHRCCHIELDTNQTLTREQYDCTRWVLTKGRKGRCENWGPLQREGRRVSSKPATAVLQAGIAWHRRQVHATAGKKAPRTGEGGTAFRDLLITRGQPAHVHNRIAPLLVLRQRLLHLLLQLPLRRAAVVAQPLQVRKGVHRLQVLEVRVQLDAPLHTRRMRPSHVRRTACCRRRRPDARPLRPHVELPEVRGHPRRRRVRCGRRRRQTERLMMVLLQRRRRRRRRRLRSSDSQLVLRERGGVDGVRRVSVVLRTRLVHVDVIHLYLRRCGCGGGRPPLRDERRVVRRRHGGGAQGGGRRHGLRVVVQKPAAAARGEGRDRAPHVGVGVAGGSCGHVVPDGAAAAAARGGAAAAATAAETAAVVERRGGRHRRRRQRRAGDGGEKVGHGLLEVRAPRLRRGRRRRRRRVAVA
eukprot:Rhum_TRINITY_DN11841_c0_g1::Rhum_TRINITY_DN11841_c0_g1_i1::g.47137::m.47137